VTVEVLVQVFLVCGDVNPVVRDFDQVLNDYRDRLMRVDIVLVLLQVRLKLFLILPKVPAIVPNIRAVR
jgi:hypothetical protein